MLDSYAFQLSGGMNQRVMIAMALVSRPALLIADEPGTALDVTVQAQTLKLMHDLTEKTGTAVLLISHNLGVVREFSDRVYVIYRGIDGRARHHRPALPRPAPSLHPRAARGGAADRRRRPAATSPSGARNSPRRSSFIPAAASPARGRRRERDPRNRPPRPDLRRRRAYHPRPRRGVAVDRARRMPCDRRRIRLGQDDARQHRPRRLHGDATAAFASTA